MVLSHGKYSSTTNQIADNAKQDITFVWPKKIAIIFSDVRPEYFATHDQYLTEKDAESDARAVAGYLEKMGSEVILVPGNADLVEKLKSEKVDLAFNLVGSVRGQEYLAATIPAALELLEIPYTGSGILGEALAYNKFIGKKLLQQLGIPIPNMQLFLSHKEPLDNDMKFPLICKLNEIHGSVEITKDSIVTSEKQLKNRIEYLIKTYDQPVLVEEFIAGKEIIAMLIEGGKREVFLVNRVFKDQTDMSFASFEFQWDKEQWDAYKYEKHVDPNIEKLVKKAFALSKMADCGKFDLRLDASGRAYFIDINSNPGFGPLELGFDTATIPAIFGVKFEDILKRIINNALHDFYSVMDPDIQRLQDIKSVSLDFSN